MYTNNPYAQGGWSNPANNLSVNDGTWGTLLPEAPTYGVLPSSTSGTPPSTLTFYFTEFNPDILDCVVVGPQSKVYYKVIPGPPGLTYVQKPDNSSILCIEWQQHPLVEVRGVIPRQPVGQWMVPAADAKSRIIEVKGKRYVWTADETYIGLYSVYPSPSELHARISNGKPGTIVLEITTSAISSGLLEVAIASVVLLRCGRNID